MENSVLNSVEETQTNVEEIVVKFGKIGQKITITRLIVKDRTNSKNKGKKIDQPETIVLEGPVVIGKPIKQTKEADEYSRKRPAKINVTSIIIGVKILSRNLYELESLSSVYKVRFH